jgi:hypothetical protein
METGAESIAAPIPARRRREDWPPRVRRKAASQYLLEVHGLTEAPATIAKKAVTGGGPEYELWGRIPYYKTEKLDDYAETRLRPRRSTSEAA